MSVPERFEETVRALEEVASEFGLETSFEELGEGRFIAHLALSWTDVVRQVAFVLDVDGPLLAVYVVLELPVADQREQELLAAVARANYGLLPGAFEFAFEERSVRYRSALWPIPDDVRTSHIAQLLSSALQVSEAYTAAFRAVIESGADPFDAIHAVESE